MPEISEMKISEKKRSGRKNTLPILRGEAYERRTAKTLTQG